MATFVFAFGLLALIMLGMAIGAMVMGKTIKGSCGGLNAVAGADKCLVCKKPVDPDSPLHERLNCPRAKQMTDRMGIEASS
ncbi:MAG: (Na+)-NQR maturation NqrM [Parvularculaceae bacterium]|nr:(Na+)-NQR maturation NqrM [Parvularculaceae bacterium]